MDGWKWKWCDVETVPLEAPAGGVSIKKADSGVLPNNKNAYWTIGYYFTNPPKKYLQINLSSE